MARSELQTVAKVVARRAQRQGFVVPSEVKDELTAAGFEADRWKEVIALIRDGLHYRQGRYYHVSTEPRPEESGQAWEAIQQFLGKQVHPPDENRRQEERTAVALTLQIREEDGQELSVVSRDLSPTGIRFVANRSLLGRKVHLALPAQEPGQEPVLVQVRILWTAAVGDGLFENGGMFLGKGQE
jgi:hypothetical protein